MTGTGLVMIPPVPAVVLLVTQTTGGLIDGMNAGGRATKLLRPPANETIKVKVDVTNTGKVIGKEIIQLYVRDVKATFARPDKELKGFEKIELGAAVNRRSKLTPDRRPIVTPVEW